MLDLHILYIVLGIACFSFLYDVEFFKLPILVDRQLGQAVVV